MSYVDNPFKSPLTSISIGPGIRGIERGVERVVRLNHIAYVEIEAFIVENLVAQMEKGVLAPAVIWSDCKTLPCDPFRRITDIIFAGYPCQPFSTAGRRKGTADPRHLYPYIERAIRTIRPRICFFENVRGHVTCGLPEVIDSLEGLGYRVRWGIYSAEETGARHKRERVFILAIMANSENDRRKGKSWRTGDREERGKLSEELAARSESVGHGEGLGHTELQPINSSIGWLRREFDSAGSKLADTINNGHSNGRGEIPCEKAEIEREAHGEEWNQEVGERVRDESKHSNDELGDTSSSRLQAGSELRSGSGQGLQKSISGSETTHINQRNERISQRECSESIGGSSGIEAMGNSNNTGLQGRNSGISEECTDERITRTNGPFVRVGKFFVSRPSQPQQAWEYPRVISRAVESSVGLSAHGYHFREDILRALGNSVYEDTAELAFKDLLRKHSIEL